MADYGISGDISRVILSIIHEVTALSDVKPWSGVPSPKRKDNSFIGLTAEKQIDVLVDCDLTSDVQAQVE